MGGSLDALVPDLRDYARALVDAADRAGLQPRITSTLRSHSEQRRLYDSFLANPGRAYPVLPPGKSAHEYGEAFDMVVTPMSALADVGYTWQSWGGGWDGRDAVHFELPGASARAARRPEEGGSFYKLADFLSGFIPGLGELQLVDYLVGLLDGNEDKASWYLQHPAEAIRDLFS
jgi:D-alanyl-D-alanine carboxypeptidase